MCSNDDNTRRSWHPFLQFSEQHRHCLCKYINQQMCKRPPLHFHLRDTKLVSHPPLPPLQIPPPFLPCVVGGGRHRSMVSAIVPRDHGTMPPTPRLRPPATPPLLTGYKKPLLPHAHQQIAGAAGAAGGTRHACSGCCNAVITRS